MIVIPTDIQIMKWLAYEVITFTLVFSSYELKEEYRNRCLERGNIEAAIDIFINDWELLDWNV